MDTSTERAVARIRKYFSLYPKRLRGAARDAGIPYTTARDAMRPNQNPRIDTVAALEGVVPASFIGTETEASDAA